MVEEGNLLSCLRKLYPYVPSCDIYGATVAGRIRQIPSIPAPT